LEQKKKIFGREIDKKKFQKIFPKNYSKIFFNFAPKLKNQK